MTTDRRSMGRLLLERRTEGPGTKVLVAVGGFCEPGRECVVGELVWPWPWPWCGRPRCGCAEEFHGSTTHGDAALARVRLLRGAPRTLVESTIAAVMRDHDGVDQPELAAASMLDDVARIEEGRLVRRESGILIPFPMSARISGPRSVDHHLSDEQ